MTDERRQDVLLFALVLSVMAHAALMFFMRPQVMTHVTGAGARSRARPPMKVREAVPLPDAVKFESVLDVDAERKSPEAEVDEPMPVAESFAAPEIAPEALAPGAEDHAPPEVPRMTVDAAPLLSEPIHVGAGVSAFTTPLSTDAPLMFMPSASAPAPAPIVEAVESVEAPAPDVPDMVPEIKLDVADAVVAHEEQPKKDEPNHFVPSKEVMDEVDERIVEEEKAAVRGLLDVKDARELSDFVNLVNDSASSGEWTYFRVQIVPRADLKTVPKDVVILMDASGSIANDRLNSCRAAAKEILRSCMNTGDRFNLVAFRDNFDYAFKTWQNCDKDAYEAADRWMDKLAAHGRTDVFATISSVLKLPRDPVRPLIALVVTDGDANAGVRGTSQILSKFTALNDGLVSVYMYGVKQSANRELIDVLTHGNRGESFIYEGNRKYAGRSIGDLSERFRDPVLTDLRVVFTAGSRAEAYPQRLRNLYRGEVVEVVGRVPAGTDEVAFSLKGLNGSKAYEGFFKVKLASASFDQYLPAAWRVEQSIDQKLR